MPEKTKIPYVPRRDCIVETRRLILNPVKVLQYHTSHKGPTFTYYFGGSQKVLVSSDANFIRHVLKNNHSNYHKSPIQTRHMVNYLGKGLLSDEPEIWQPKRKKMQKGFKVDDLDTQAMLMYQALLECLADFEQSCNKGPINLAPAICRFVFTMTARALFGITMSPAEIHQISSTVSTVQAFMVRQVFQPYLNPWFYLSGQVAKHQTLRRKGDALLFQHIKSRLAQAPTLNQPGNLLDIMFTMMKDDNIRPLILEQVLAEAMQFLIAGHETSSNTLVWVMTLLDQNPRYLRMMLDELRQVVGTRPVTYSDLRHLPLTQAILDEAMRLYPPFWMLDRIALEADDIGGLSIARGDNIMCFLYGLHRDPRLWENPDSFIPERFMAARNPAKGLIHIPFGTGPRRCIGEQLARLQMVLILQTFYSRYQFELTNPVAELQPHFTLSRKGGLPATVRCL